MNWTEQRIRDIIADVITENPMACRSLLEISAIEFTDRVPTMAVSLGEQPVLCINLGFCTTHLRSENDVKCVLLHEFLHVLMLHTSIYQACDPMLNVALDAIINAVIWREQPDYAEFFSRFYTAKPPQVLLRPMDWTYHNQPCWEWRFIHDRIYQRGYCADELYELLNVLRKQTRCDNWDSVMLLGNHEPKPIGDATRQVLDGIMEKMTGVDIWRRSDKPGAGSTLYLENRNLKNFRMNRWNQTATALIRKCVLPEKGQGHRQQGTAVAMPVLSPTDRRSFIRFRTGGIIPYSIHTLSHSGLREQATVFLDVSGSMNPELDALASLLYRLRDLIRLPLLAFSNRIATASFRNGRLQTESTGGTSIDCVFDHIRTQRIKKALIVTDGFLGAMTGHMVKDLDRKNIFFLLTSQHNEHDVREAGFHCRALPGIDWAELALQSS